MIMDQRFANTVALIANIRHYASCILFTPILGMFNFVNYYMIALYFLQLETVHNHLERYFLRFRSLLGPTNRRYIQTLMVLTQAFLRVLLDDKDGNLIGSSRDIDQASEKSSSDFTVAINDFLFEQNIDNINLVKLLKYIKESNIMHKVNLGT